MPAEKLINRDDAVALHRSGQVTAAIAAYKGLLVQDPENADILGLLGVAAEQAGNFDEAERLLRLSLRNTSDTPLLYRNFNNLVGLLIEAGRDADSKALAHDTDLPTWPESVAPDQIQRNTIVSVIEALRTLGQEDRALAIADQVRRFFGGDLNFATQRAELLHHAGRLLEARDCLAQDFGPEGKSASLQILRGAIAFETRNFKESADSAERFAELSPTFLAPERRSQKFVLAVLNPAPEQIRVLGTAEGYHYTGNFPSQLSTEFADDYRFLSVFPDSPTAWEALQALPRPALALNNFVNAEKLLVEGKLAQVSAFVDRLGIPVLNHPKQVAQVTRQKNAERLASVEGILAPRITRYLSSRLLRDSLTIDIEARYGYPMIVRTVFEQMGQGTWLAHNREQLHEALDATEGQQVYIINYYDLRHENGFYRRIRAAFVNKIWTIIRIDYDSYWNVRGRREHHIVDFYRKHPDLMDLCDRMTADPHEAFDASVLARLDDIARVVPLDIFGLDFDITDDGKLAVFEANATMNFLANAEGGLTYPQEAQKRVTDAFHRLFEDSALKRVA
jgi:tetratricopeptide (TPR) repeat protein